MNLRLWIPCSLFVVVAASRCQRGDDAPVAEDPTPPAAVADAADAEPEGLDQGGVAASRPNCVGPIEAGETVSVRIAGQSWEHSGSTLRARSGLKKNRLVVGALADIKEDSEENLRNLDKLLDNFKKAKVDLVVVAGDSGLDREEIINVVARVATAKVPVLVGAGNREGEADFTEALAQVSAEHNNVFNLNKIRRVDTPVADLISLPGYFDAGYIHAEDGCQYFQEDVDALGELVRASDSPVVLVSHGGPRQSGDEALDLTAEGQHVGDPMLTEFLQDYDIKFGIFGNIHESGGRATELTGDTRLDEGKRHDTLFLNPGPADAVAWQMNDGTDSVGMAAVMTLTRAGQASYRVNRIADPKKSRARKLARKAKR